mmetsp:Transcript_34903/g.98967  ORF Transcript_34903/g.98967 Transcript_34903/m.98967 type:complete len:622 (-) Transcript_34903:425-2290(-)
MWNAIARQPSSGSPMGLVRPRIRAAVRTAAPGPRPSQAPGGGGLCRGPFVSRPRQLHAGAMAQTGAASTTTLTQRMFEEAEKRGNKGSEAGGAGGATSYEGLQRVDKIWEGIRNQPTGAAAGKAPDFVSEVPAPLDTAPEVDVVVCGGTLGIFIATVLQLKGHKVAVFERGTLSGRSQDWNISRKELEEAVKLGVLTRAEAEDSISIEFNPVRAVFHGAEDEAVWTKDVLNLGVAPAKLVKCARKRFEDAGGLVFERTGVQGIAVHPNGAALKLDSPERTGITTRLVLDCMGHGSPITRQLRWGKKPDGMCLVVGCCARGPWPDNGYADIIATDSPMQPRDAEVTNLQYFWEAFPAGTHPQDRTTYMFTYLDAEPHRPSLEAMFEDYWKMMPEYQEVDLEDLEVQRLVFGFFPTFRDSPLLPGWDRVLQAGDASGIQSPLSFGGFGALTRHMERLTGAVGEALDADVLSKSDLSLINAYNPGLSGAWMLQRAMSVRPGENPDPQFINKLLSTNFSVMRERGEETLKPFLQDVIQFRGLASTMAGQMVKAPMSVPEIIGNVGLGPVLDWTSHFITMGAYTVLSQTLEGPLKARAEKLDPKERYRLNRRLEAWRFGAGLDFKP